MGWQKKVTQIQCLIRLGLSLNLGPQGWQSEICVSKFLIWWQEAQQHATTCSGTILCNMITCRKMLTHIFKLCFQRTPMKTTVGSLGLPHKMLYIPLISQVQGLYSKLWTEFFVLPFMKTRKEKIDDP